MEVECKNYENDTVKKVLKCFDNRKEIGSWKIYREGLKPPYCQHFDNIMLYARKHSDAGSLSARMFISESLFLSALIEQQKTLDKMEKEFYRIKRRAKI